MAYKTTVSKSCTNRQAALDEIFSQMEAAGWTLVDGNFTALTMAYTAVSVANDTFTTTGTVPADGTPCQLTTSGTVPTGLAINTLYYIVSRTDTTFKLAATYNGTAINITAQGSGNHTIKEALRVYKSNGENADRIYEFVSIQSYVATTDIRAYTAYKYDTTTKALTAQTFTGYTPYVATSESGFYLWLYMNKSHVFIFTKVSTTYYRANFGHGNPWINTPLTILTADATSGSSVTITVTSTENFEAGYTYQIVGAAMEGRDSVVVSSITNSTQMVITSLPRNFATGAKIGTYPSCFGHHRSGSYTFYISCPSNVSGLVDSGTYSNVSLSSMFATTCIDLSFRTGKYSLVSVSYDSEYKFAVNDMGLAGLGFYLDDFVLLTGSAGVSVEDTFTVTQRDTGTSSGSNSSTTLNNTAKSWTVNAFADKVVVIIFGTGIGQIKKIASNTSTQLTLESGWTFSITPDNTSQYIICDKAFRILFDTTANGIHAFREGY
jgi:hypothetical protein